MNLSTFRSSFPEFASVSKYPDALVTFWSDVAEKMVIESRWGNMYQQGVMLYTAHSLVLASQNQKSTSTGGIPGIGAGAISSKKVGEASVNYDVATTSTEGAGQWNLTVYGRQYIQLANIMGAGAVQL